MPAGWLPYCIMFQVIGSTETLLLLLAAMVEFLLLASLGVSLHHTGPVGWIQACEGCALVFQGTPRVALKQTQKGTSLAEAVNTGLKGSSLCGTLLWGSSIPL